MALSGWLSVCWSELGCGATSNHSWYQQATMVTKEACTVRLTGIIACAAVLMLLLISVITVTEASESFESRCAVENTVVNFHCPDSTGWRIDYLTPQTTGPVTFTINNETGLVEDMHIVTNQEYLQMYGNVSLIMCIHRDHGSFAIVAITDPSQPELQLFPTLIPQSWTSLYLEWESPEYEYGLPYVDYNYAITLSGDDGYFEVISVVVNGSETPGLYLDLGGYECVQLHINISLPGNCEPTRIPVALLLDPPYPMPGGMEVVVLNTTGLALTWEHPENMFGDDHFNYSVSAVVVSTGDVISQYTTSLSASHTPWEEFDLSGSVDACEEINFTLSLVGDCRVIHTTATLPAYPEDFISEEIDVAILFSMDLSLQKIEIMFAPPNLCPTQTAYYILTFDNHDDDITWSTESKRLRGTSGVVEEVIQPDRFELDKNYSVTVTIITIVGNVSTNATFNICTLLGGAPHDLSIQSIGRNNARLSWQKQCSTSALPVTYEVTAVLVSNRDAINERHFVHVLADEESPSLQLRMEQYACRDVNYTVRVFGHKEMVSVVEALPAYPEKFEKDVKLDFSLARDGTFKEIEVVFTPPSLCEFQSSSYVLSYTDGNETWTRDPVPITDTSQPIKEEIESGIDMYTMYTVTVTVFTDFGNISSNATFDACTIQVGAPSELSMTVFGHDSAQLSWVQQCNAAAPSTAYMVTAVLVSTGDVILNKLVEVLSDKSPSFQLTLEEYACVEVNYTIKVYGREEAVSIVETLAAYPEKFEKDVKLDFPLARDGTFKEIEVVFTPPRLCEFQSSSYVLSYTDGNETWTRDPVPITDTSQPIKEEIEFGIDTYTMYTVTATVFTDFGNISSNATFVRDVQTGAASTASTSGVPVYIIVVAVVAALVCGAIGGVIVLYSLRQRKRRREREKEMSQKKIHQMVVNPLYEATDDHYEHLPDFQAPPSLSVQAATPTPLSGPGEPKHTDITPILPPPRKDFKAGESTGEKPSLTDTQGKSPKRASTMLIPESCSLGDVSACSAEDCYTIMSPAGTVTMLPRNTSSANPSTSVGASDLGIPAPNDDKCMDSTNP